MDTKKRGEEQKTGRIGNTTNERKSTCSWYQHVTSVYSTDIQFGIASGVQAVLTTEKLESFAQIVVGICCLERMKQIYRSPSLAKGKLHNIKTIDESLNGVHYMTPTQTMHYNFQEIPQNYQQHLTLASSLISPQKKIGSHLIRPSGIILHQPRFP